jgi:lipopolysaccharide transport system ATP-binding protein
MDNQEKSVIFDDVWKYYPLYHQITGGIKRFLINMPAAVKQMRESKFWAVNGLSFEVNKGEAFGIMGPNGAGKSTVMAMIAGVIKPSRGKVTVKGRVAPLLELGAGFHHDLTGRENAVLNGILLGMTKREITGRLDQILAFAELGEFIDQPIRTYSSGMMARLGFSVAIHTDPEILLVDEILAVGDESFQRKCFAKMNEFKERSITIILISHDRTTMERFCDRIIEIKDGKLDSTLSPTHTA